MAYTTIDNPELYFQAKTYSGTGSTNSVTLDGDEDMQPDLVWVKEKVAGGGNENHGLVDAVRGVTKSIHSNSGNAESTDTGGVTAFNSDGFTVVDSDAFNGTSGRGFVAWCWKESATRGFDIVAYTGNETARTISHSLSAVPSMMIVKNRESSYGWQVYHHKNTSAPETEIIYLHDTTATADSNVEWNDTAPTSSVFTVGTDVGVNQDTKDLIAYLWSEVQGFSKFGSYTGNGNADGPFVYTGFLPAFLMCKRTDSTDNWMMIDNKRDSINLVDGILFADLNQAEVSGDACDFTANGFKIRGTSTWINASGGTYIYMAFAEAPFVNSNGVPGNAR